MTLRFKLALIAASLTFLGLALGLTITYWSILSFRLADIDRENRALAELVLGVTTRSSDSVPAALEAYLGRNLELGATRIYRHEGVGSARLLWQGGGQRAPDPLDRDGLGERAATRTAASWRVTTLSEGALTVQVGRSLAALQDTLYPFDTVAAPLALVLSLLSGVIAWVAAGLALRPLELLTRATSDFDQLRALPPIPGNDEAATLGAHFNALLERLQARQAQERRFLAYAAHELRTPISALRASLEAARTRQQAPGPELLERLHREALRLESFAQNLLALSRAETQEVRAHVLDLADLAARAYDRLQPLALESGHELVLDCQPAPAHGDPRLLEQALNNLVANAVHHTPAGQVMLRSGLHQDQAYLEVADTGPGLPDPMTEGLGLRVARAVAAAHGGTLETDCARGCRMRLLLTKGTPARAARWRAPLAARAQASKLEAVRRPLAAALGFLRRTRPAPDSRAARAKP